MECLTVNRFLEYFMGVGRVGLLRWVRRETGYWSHKTVNRSSFGREEYLRTIVSWVFFRR